MSSQLNVDTIVDKAGSGGTNVKVANTSTYVSDGGAVTQNTVQALAKQWATHTQASTYVLDDSFNVASITDNGTGETTVTFTNQPSNANYAVTFGTGFKNRFAIANANNTTRVKIECNEVQGINPAIDGADIHHVVHGDLA